jgi:hypothetical protein
MYECIFAVEEVEHGVVRRIHACCEGGPCHRGQRRKGGSQAVEAALFAEAAHVGQLTDLAHPARGRSVS